MLELKELSKIYPGEHAVKALDKINIKFELGCFAAIIGPSGSGKSTLLNIVSGLDKPTTGQVLFEGEDITQFSNTELVEYRRQNIGFIFQSYNLIESMTAVENVEFTLLMRGVDKQVARDQAIHSLQLVGLAGKEYSFPKQLSGGQQQRVAVARALASKAKIIFADEPTANLDSKTSLKLIELFQQLNNQNQTSFIFSTHDPELIHFTKRQVAIKDGAIESDQ